MYRFNNYYSTESPRKRVLIISGEHKGKSGLLMGRWDSDYQNWTIKIDTLWVHIMKSGFVFKGLVHCENPEKI